MESILSWAFNHPYGFAIGIFSFFSFIPGAVALWLYRAEIKAWFKQKISQKQTVKEAPQSLTSKKKAQPVKQKTKDKDKPNAIAAHLQNTAKSFGLFMQRQWKRLKQLTFAAKNKTKQILPKHKPQKDSVKSPATSKKVETTAKAEQPEETKNQWLQNVKVILRKVSVNIKKIFVQFKNFIIKITSLVSLHTRQYYQKIALWYKNIKAKKTAKKPVKASNPKTDQLSKEDILAAFAQSDQTTAKKEEDTLDAPLVEGDKKETLLIKPEEQNQKDDEIAVKQQEKQEKPKQKEEEASKNDPAESLLDGFVPLSLSQEVTHIQKRPPFKFVYLGGTFHKTYKNWALALSSPYLMAFNKPIDRLAFETQTLLKIERITNRVQLFNRLEKLRIGFVRHEHDQLVKRVLNLSETDKEKFLHKHQGHQAYAKFQYIANNPKLYQNADFLVFDIILAISLVREACSPEVQLLTEDEAKMLLYRLVYPLYQKAYSWAEISDNFRAALHLYYAKSTRLTKRLSENLDALFNSPESPWIKLDDMNYHLDKSEYKITPPVLEEQQFDIYLSDSFRDFYGSQTSYQEAFYMVKRTSSLQDFCSFINSFSYGVEYISHSVLKPIGDNLGLYENERRALATGFILLGSDYIKDLMSDPDYALTKAAEYLLYRKDQVVLPYVCFGLCCDSLAQSVQHLFEISTQEGQNLFGLNITMEQLEEVKQQALRLSSNYSSDWNDYPQFVTWLQNPTF